MTNQNTTSDTMLLPSHNLLWWSLLIPFLVANLSVGGFVVFCKPEQGTLLFAIGAFSFAYALHILSVSVALCGLQINATDNEKFQQLRKLEHKIVTCGMFVLGGGLAIVLAASCYVLGWSIARYIFVVGVVLQLYGVLCYVLSERRWADTARAIVRSHEVGLGEAKNITEKVPCKKTFSERLNINLDIFLKILIIIPLFIFFGYFYFSFKDKTIVLIDNIEITNKLQELGYTRTTLTNKLQEHISDIRNKAKMISLKSSTQLPIYCVETIKRPSDLPTKTSYSELYKTTTIKDKFDNKKNENDSNIYWINPQVINLNEIPNIEIKIAGTSFPLYSFFLYLKNYFGIPPIHISGEITSQSNSNKLNLTIRVIDKSSETFNDTLENLDKNLLIAAEYLYQFIDPSTLAFYLYGKSITDKCIEIIKYCLDNNPLKDDYLAYFLWGFILDEQNNPIEAIEKYENAIKKNPKFKDAYYRLAVILHNKNEYSQAIQNFNKAYKYGLENATSLAAITYNNWGNSLADQSKYEDAITMFELAVIHDQNCSMAYANWGEALYRLARYDEAIVKYQKSIDLSPQAGTYCNMGLAHQDKQDYNNAINIYKKTINIYPDCCFAYYYLGIIYSTTKKHKDYNKAIRMFEKTIKLSPKMVEAYFNLCNIFKEQGKLVRENKMFLKAIRLCDIFDNQGKLVRENKRLIKDIRFDLQLKIKRIKQNKHLLNRQSQ